MAWKNLSKGDLLAYDFTPPRQWTSERTAEEQAAIASLLETCELVPGAADAPGGLQLAMRLPDEFRATLIAELRAANQLANISSTGWPGEGSVVVSLCERFSVARRAPPAGVVWRELNDPHYWREELSQKVGQVEFLVIC